MTGYPDLNVKTIWMGLRKWDCIEEGIGMLFSIIAKWFRRQNPYPSIDQPLVNDCIQVGENQDPWGRWFSSAKSDFLRRLSLGTVAKEFTRKLENCLEGTLWMVCQAIYFSHHHKLVSTCKLLFGCFRFYVTAFINNSTINDCTLNGVFIIVEDS